MAHNENRRTGAVIVICTIATAVYYCYVTPSLAHATGTLSSPAFFAYWRWYDAVHALGAGFIALVCQIVLAVWARRRNLRTDLPKLMIYTSLYWLMVCCAGTALYGASREHPPWLYLAPTGMNGPVWFTPHPYARRKLREHPPKSYLYPPG
jgi:hypothetical protein